MFAVAGTLISTLVFGLLTYFLVIIHVVQRSALGPAPLTECMLYGADASPPQRVCPALLTENGRCTEMVAYIHFITRQEPIKVHGGEAAAPQNVCASPDVMPPYWHFFVKCPAFLTESTLRGAHRLRAVATECMHGLPRNG